MVRLLPVNQPIQVSENEGFNPTMVRLLPEYALKLSHRR